jgi:hypothetical protein
VLSFKLYIRARRPSSTTKTSTGILAQKEGEARSGAYGV